MLEAELANENSPYKIRIYGQAIVYQRRKIPKNEMQTMPSGVQVPVKNWYDEFECQQLAVNYNGLYINEKQLDELLEQLKQAVKKSLRDKGIVQ